MQEVYPVSHKTIYPYIGRRVSAVTHDGRHFIGTITGIKDGKLMVENCTFDKKPLTLSSVRNGKHSAKQTRSQHKARLSGYDSYGGGYDGYGGGYNGCGGGYGGGYGGGFGGGGFFFPLAIIASLFILPFFCI
ncbi:hypothetical protein [Paenibacillus radicis (ex Gao et al. 2016)]|uniref:Uncharacterized protein n=1 Tax=Paenibacillus radicis (ex Gao et al. 2016) TaxID=1737354 RepID=A0A917H855_9BACL|nr:hypothetical protein [Paenibacillus radicis (ex Gao et al. 2016)]GGG70317.1 hypothetical protein GCM10010918_27050 [Paenibacillus radicis (ex Gao et al. 2016)]